MCSQDSDKNRKTITALTRIMPTIGGATSSNSAALQKVTQLIILYGALVWGQVIKYDKYRNF